MLIYRDELIANCRLTWSVLWDGSDIEFELDDLHREIEVLSSLSRKVINENTHVTVNQEECLRNNNRYLDRFRKESEVVVELERLKREKHSINTV